jgi:hypothetical protein
VKVEGVVRLRAGEMTLGLIMLTKVIRAIRNFRAIRVIRVVRVIRVISQSKGAVGLSAGEKKKNIRKDKNENK